MSKRAKFIAIAGIAASFATLAGLTAMLWAKSIISPEMTILMLVALFGLYFGFGVLFAVYRLVSALD